MSHGEVKRADDARLSQFRPLDPSKRYEGPPCKFGHGTERYVANGVCVVCNNGRKAKRYKVDPVFRKRMGALIRHKKTGMSPEEYDRLLIEQDGRRYCCRGTNSNGTALSADHCHTTGALGRLLCNRCNMAVGILENPLLPSWKAYMEEFRHGAQ